MIKFADITIISQAEGVYLPPPVGIPQRAWQFKKLIRTDGEVAFDKGRGGCDHSVTVVFKGVAVGNVQTIWNRMDSFQAIPREGALEIPDFDPFPNCVCTGVQPSPAARVIRGLAMAGSLSYTSGYDMEFTLTFRQTRAS